MYNYEKEIDDLIEELQKLKRAFKSSEEGKAFDEVLDIDKVTPHLRIYSDMNDAMYSMMLNLLRSKYSDDPFELYYAKRKIRESSLMLRNGTEDFETLIGKRIKEDLCSNLNTIFLDAVEHNFSGKVPEYFKLNQCPWSFDELTEDYDDFDHKPSSILLGKLPERM